MSTRPTTPYSHNLGDRDPLVAIRESTEQIRAMTSTWLPELFERSYAAGKWPARLVLTHLAQTELALGTRARMALTVPGYVAQPFDQDAWMVRESGMTGRTAADVFLAVAGMNRVFFEGLSAADREMTLSHPEYGRLTVDWIIYQLAGHQIHHLLQLEEVRISILLASHF